MKCQVRCPEALHFLSATSQQRQQRQATADPVVCFRTLCMYEDPKILPILPRTGHGFGPGIRQLSYFSRFCARDHTNQAKTLATTLTSAASEPLRIAIFASRCAATTQTCLRTALSHLTLDRTRSCKAVTPRRTPRPILPYQTNKIEEEQQELRDSGS